MSIASIIINALFTGIGTAPSLAARKACRRGLAIFEYWVKPYINKFHKTHKRVVIDIVKHGRNAWLRKK